MVPIMSTEPSYQPIQSQIKLGVNRIKPWLICDQVHMSNKPKDSTIASESEHDFGELKLAAPKNMVLSVKHVHNLLYGTAAIRTIKICTIMYFLLRAYVDLCKYVYV